LQTSLWPAPYRPKVGLELREHAEHVQEAFAGRGAGVKRYSLDDHTRDVLIAHARQDAAHALLNTATLLEQSRALRRGFRIVLFLLFGLILALVIPLGLMLSPFFLKG
jgi:hypothetical protein